MGNYAITYTNGALTVGHKALTVTVANKTKVYGEANPELTGAFSGPVAGDGLTVSYSTTATLIVAGACVIVNTAAVLVTL